MIKLREDGTRVSSPWAEHTRRGWEPRSTRLPRGRMTVPLRKSGNRLKVASVQWGQDTVQVLGIPAGPRLADAAGSPARRPGLPADAAPGACCMEAGLGALSDQCPLELGDSAQHLQQEHALRRAGVARVAQAAECAPPASSCSMTASR